MWLRFSISFIKIYTPAHILPTDSLATLPITENRGQEFYIIPLR